MLTATSLIGVTCLALSLVSWCGGGIGLASPCVRLQEHPAMDGRFPSMLTCAIRFEAREFVPAAEPAAK